MLVPNCLIIVTSSFITGPNIGSQDVVAWLDAGSRASVSLAESGLRTESFIRKAETAGYIRRIRWSDAGSVKMCRDGCFTEQRCLEILSNNLMNYDKIDYSKGDIDPNTELGSFDRITLNIFKNTVTVKQLSTKQAKKYLLIRAIRAERFLQDLANSDPINRDRRHLDIASGISADRCLNYWSTNGFKITDKCGTDLALAVIDAGHLGFKGTHSCISNYSNAFFVLKNEHGFELTTSRNHPIYEDPKTAYTYVVMLGKLFAVMCPRKNAGLCYIKGNSAENPNALMRETGYSYILKLHDSKFYQYSILSRGSVINIAGDNHNINEVRETASRIITLLVALAAMTAMSIQLTKKDVARKIVNQKLKVAFLAGSDEESSVELSDKDLVKRVAKSISDDIVENIVSGDASSASCGKKLSVKQTKKEKRNSTQEAPDHTLPTLNREEMGQAASVGSTSDHGKTTETGAPERPGLLPQATGSAEPSSDKLATDLPASPTSETKYSGVDKLGTVSDNSAGRAKPSET